jgi:GNAT superfamily N-acetyltransferase
MTAPFRPQVVLASLDDLSEVLRVQQVAFGRVAAQFGLDPHQLPPLIETLDDLRALHASGTDFFIATAPSGAVIGSVRALPMDGIVEIGRLVVDDGWLRRGVGTALMVTLESSYPAARAFRLFTGAEASAPLNLYAALGYRETERDESHGVSLVWLEKSVVQPS